MQALVGVSSNSSVRRDPPPREGVVAGKSEI
jgi:hypothetical protein